MSGDAFPIITTVDLDDTRAFYEELGFVESYRFPEQGTAEFVTLTRDAAIVGIARGEGTLHVVARELHHGTTQCIT